MLTTGLLFSCGDDDMGTCGDGRRNLGEECDFGMNYNYNPFCHCGESCTWEGPACDGDVCGDGIPTGDEECDGTALHSMTCESLGYSAGTLVCTADCRYDTSQCGPELCGNGTCDSGETLGSCPADCAAES